jgi:hypothetical protein
VTYEDIRPKLSGWSVKEFDASPLMDQWSFNDSYWNNFVGDLVEYSNAVDPDTPCGYVGGQSPNAFGGYDYASRCVAPNLGILCGRYVVPDAAAYAATLRSRGVTPYTEPTRVDVAPYGVLDLFSVRTPDGAILEFYSPAKA